MISATGSTQALASATTAPAPCSRTPSGEGYASPPIEGLVEYVAGEKRGVSRFLANTPTQENTPLLDPIPVLVPGGLTDQIPVLPVSFLFLPSVLVPLGPMAFPLPVLEVDFRLLLAVLVPLGR